MKAQKFTRYLRTYSISLLFAASFIPMNAYADLGTDLLQQIAINTEMTMVQLNLAPETLWLALQTELSWLSPDKTSTTSNLQADLANYSATATIERAFQITQQTNINQAIFGSSPVANANDLSFQTLLGFPVNSPDPRQQKDQPQINFNYNYLVNSSGLGITHVAPNASWSGAQADQTNYANYYNAITAIESYNAYVLSQMYAQTANNFLETSARNQLIADASSSNWFSQVASENLGVVLRQILMFNSQTFMVLTEMLDTQKQMLAAQAMGNTLAVLTGQTNESLLLRKASQQMPGGSS